MHATPRRLGTASRSTAAPATLAAIWHYSGATLRILIHRPLLALTIAIACILLVGAAGEAATAAQIDAQITQARVQNIQTSQQIAQTNATIAQLSQDSAIIAAALKLGYVMPASTP